MQELFLQIDRKILKLQIKSIGHSGIQNYGKKRGEIHIELYELLVSDSQGNTAKAFDLIDRESGRIAITLG
ncbi:MAG: hypothetical protein M3286_07295 [Thermoproteota archaeon]|nr:hypothetical protein [Thermoproteota archaeon]